MNVSHLVKEKMLVHIAVICLLNSILCIWNAAGDVGMLYPQDSESRQTKFLDGVWQFRVDNSPSRNLGFTQEWWKNPLSESGPVIDMPVPSSYNDVTEDKDLRDFVGWAWYGRGFYVSSDWASNKRVVLRIDSAHYYSVVWVNGNEVMRHDGGHLPFEAEVMDFLNFKGLNYITVAVNNTLTPTTLPPGTIVYENDTSKYPPGYFVQKLQFDFFNYAGIHRHVRLYTTPLVYIDDITILTDYADNKGTVSYEVIVGGGTASYAQITLIDADGSVVANSTKLSDTFDVPFPRLWYPYGMNMSAGNMYTLQLNVSGDMYRQEFGIRTVKVTGNQILINDKPFYCLGVAKHEDSDLRGKGLDYTLITKDFNMLRWLGVNCIRTSHYPYAEEILQFADRQGVAVIDESPGVGITKAENFGNVSLQHHIEVMGEMIRRDKNKPSVIMWSIANEPSTDFGISVPYFRAVLNYTKTTDPAHRPVTFVSDQLFEADRVVPYVDVICINRYYGWYTDMGHLEVIQRQLAREFAGFRNLYQKPIIVTEYGADTVSGLHREPSFVFTEEYQVDFLEAYHKEFDVARQDFLVGEMVWNFADFMTDEVRRVHKYKNVCLVVSPNEAHIADRGSKRSVTEAVNRVVGNKKGLLTRQRQPKPAAFVIRDRYNAIASGLNTTSCGCRSRKASKYSMPHTYPQIP